MATRIPSKLKSDSIIEALCEVRFQCSNLPEVTIGRLTDCPIWKDFKAERTPFADIPEAIRQIDPNLRYQSIYVFKSMDGSRLIRLGKQVISLHIVGDYCGGKQFQKELSALYKYLFNKLDDVVFTRMGFRYVNALSGSKHGIHDIHDLEISIEAGGEDVKAPVNLNFSIEDDSLHKTTRRIASPSFIKGALPQDTSVVIDIDVTTPDEIKIETFDEAKNWTNEAHIYEKKAFFSLIPKNVLNKLVESW